MQQNSVLSIRVHNTYPSFSGKSCLEKGEKIVFRNPEKSGKNHKKHGQKSRAWPFSAKKVQEKKNLGGLNFIGEAKKLLNRLAQENKEMHQKARTVKFKLKEEERK